MRIILRKKVKKIREKAPRTDENENLCLAAWKNGRKST